MDTSKFSIWEFFLFNHSDVFPIPAFPPYDVQTLHSMKASTMESIARLWGAFRALEVLRGGSWRLKSGQSVLVLTFGAGLGGQGSQDAAQEAGGSGAATRTRSYAHCGLEDMSADNKGTRNIF